MQRRFAEPDPKLVESAIVKVLEIAQFHGITAVDFIQMLDSGMRIPDFLNSVDFFATGRAVHCDTDN